MVMHFVLVARRVSLCTKTPLLHDAPVRRLGAFGCPWVKLGVNSGRIQGVARVVAMI